VSGLAVAVVLPCFLCAEQGRRKNYPDATDPPGGAVFGAGRRATDNSRAYRAAWVTKALGKTVVIRGKPSREAASQPSGWDQVREGGAPTD